MSFLRTWVNVFFVVITLEGVRLYDTKGSYGEAHLLCGPLELSDTGEHLLESTQSHVR